MSIVLGNRPANEIYKALHDRGILNEDPDTVSRVIIDLQVGHVAKLYVRYLDVPASDELTQILTELGVLENISPE